ncbi:MAG TPA: cytochrome c peroxidase [Prosthecobacter sp.]|nr:cytochrome c peroxidase [Prosthecobacter sp.]
MKPAPRLLPKMPVLLLAAALACAAQAPDAALTLVFQPVAGNEPLVLDAPRHRNAAGETWSVSRLSYLVSGVSLQRADGSWLGLPDAIAWMDAATRRDTLRIEKIPAGPYQALRFHIGLDPLTNAADPASHPPEHPLNPNLNGLHWSWQGGYIFLVMEGLHGTDPGRLTGYAFHLAREPFRTAVTLPCALDLRDDAALRVLFDTAAVLDAVKPVSFAKDGATTHSKDGDPLALALRENLARAFRLPPDAFTAGVSASAPLPPAPTLPGPDMGAAFPQLALPADNPLTAERSGLGKRLFHETALSRDGSISCASCHHAGAALSDPRRFSPGIEGRTGDRNAMPLFNLAWKKEFFWDGRAPSLRAQALIPIEDHREMDEKLENVVAKLERQPAWTAAFQKAFGTPEITPERIGLALENFLLGLTSHDSKFDKAQRGEAQLSAEEQRGFELFMTEREPRLGALGADCFHCHGGALFTDHQFRNNGLPVSDADPGRYKVTGVSIDRGAFATPSLRNIALTAPYMHDGRFATLEEVVDHYSTGVQRTDTLDPNLAKHPDGGLHLTQEDKKALLAFLRTLTDDRFAASAHADPP